MFKKNNNNNKNLRGRLRTQDPYHQIRGIESSTPA